MKSSIQNHQEREDPMKGEGLGTLLCVENQSPTLNRKNFKKPRHQEKQHRSRMHLPGPSDLQRDGINLLKMANIKFHCIHHMLNIHKVLINLKLILEAGRNHMISFILKEATSQVG